MLNRPWQAGEARVADSGRESEFIGLADITAFVRRYIVSIALCVFAGAGLALFSLATTDPIYSADAQILIEPKLPQYLQQSSGVTTSLDTAQVESQMAVMRSERIAQLVIDQLGLMDNPDFFDLHQPSIPEKLAKFVKWGREAVGLDALPSGAAGLASGGDDEAADAATDLTEFERGRIAITLFGSNLDIRRIGVSYVIGISFRSRSAELAAQVANATVDTFVRDQIDTKAAAARQGGEWLEQRMSEMREKMNTATQIAQEFRSRHDYSVRPPGARLVNGQVVYDAQGDVAGEPTLEELEVTADTYRQMYESFLLAFTNNLSQQSYPVADARVITAATRPLLPSRPRKKLVLAFGLFAGLMTGVGQAFARSALDRTVRTPRQIQDQLGVRCLAELPVVGAWNGGAGLPDQVAVAPESTWSENLRRAKFAIRREGTLEPVRTLGIVSALPSTSKSVVASNLALLYAMSGRRTLLVDADPESGLRGQRFFGGRSAPRPAAEGNQIVTGALGGVDLLPGIAPDEKPADWVAGGAGYDMVVVDLPPLASGFEGLAISAELDGVVLVAEWGRSTIDGTAELVTAIRAHDAPVIGAILGKARFLSTRPQRRARHRR
jgi:uncharacterized protein involved in exopolysaccharide biosynthesis/Mrp family chromosome partitioning ATPase